MMREDGLVIFLDRSLSLLTPTADRPTASTQEAMAERYRERRPIYTAVSHITISADATPHEVCNAILEELNT